MPLELLTSLKSGQTVIRRAADQGKLPLASQAIRKRCLTRQRRDFRTNKEIMSSVRSKSASHTANSRPNQVETNVISPHVTLDLTNPIEKSHKEIMSTTWKTRNQTKNVGSGVAPKPTLKDKKTKFSQSLVATPGSEFSFRKNMKRKTVRVRSNSATSTPRNRINTLKLESTENRNKPTASAKRNPEIGKTTPEGTARRNRPHDNDNKVDSKQSM